MDGALAKLIEDAEPFGITDGHLSHSTVLIPETFFYLWKILNIG